MALDSSGLAQLLYRDDVAYKLKYARSDGVSWHTDSTPPDRYTTDLAIDSAGFPYFVSQGTGGVEFHRWDGNQWISEIVTSEQGFGESQPWIQPVIHASSTSISRATLADGI